MAVLGLDAAGEEGLVVSLRGIHHVKVPVSDVFRSRDWYQDVLGFSPILDFEEEDRVVGVAVELPVGVTVGLHADPVRARALRGFCVLALSVASDRALGAWARHLDEAGIAHSAIVDTETGTAMTIPDPDGILVALHTPRHPAPDDA
jgi:catechol 2,3-dioxygenase-like lactoylglutathione lyase family enzyme